jgi:hypothetical protein
MKWMYSWVGSTIKDSAARQTDSAIPVGVHLRRDVQLVGCTAGLRQPELLIMHTKMDFKASDVLPGRLTEHYETALRDPKLLSLKGEIALADARIIERLEQAKTDGLDARNVLIA